MNFRYTYSIEIETELELPVLGYDIKEAADELLKDEIPYIIDRSNHDPRSTQIFTVKDRTYRIKKGSRINNS